MDKPINNIFSYICYRAFLSDYYKCHKTNTYGFSYRVMSERLGFSSPNFLKLVIDGERNIGKESLKKITQGIGLNKLESEYFSYLVFFQQAKSAIDKNYYYALMASLRNSTVISKIAPEQYEYFNEWYHPAIRELVAGKQEPLDYNSLANTLSNRITVPQLKKSVALLLRLNLIRLNDNNVYEHVCSLINTENELQTYAVRRYHKEVISVASSILDTVAPRSRENSHATLRLSSAGFQKIKKRIQDFREEILQLASEDSNVDNIYHVNIQLYPITKNDENAPIN